MADDTIIDKEKINVSKMDAAKFQLCEAIMLFFEERDPVSIHTLACASLSILHDYIKDKNIVYDLNLIFHFDTIFIKDEYKKDYAGFIRDSQNFFKHADRDLGVGRTEIEFDPNITPFYILEAIRCIHHIESSDYAHLPEFKIFWIWYGLKYPNHMVEPFKNFCNSQDDLNCITYENCKKIILLLKADSNYLDRLG